MVVVADLVTFPAWPGLPVVPPEALADSDAPGPPAGATVAGPDDPAYVIYTSGSTGQPKGVEVPHGNVVSLLAATVEEFALGERDVWTLFHSSAFDFSVWEIWGCLMTGGRLVVVPYWVTRDAERFAELLADERVTVLNQTPSAFTQLMEVDRRRRVSGSVRLVVFGGEPLDVRPLCAWFDRHPERDCRLVNMFGITETTVHVTAQTVSRPAALAGSRSVGRALPGWHLYVLDPAGRPVPPGVAGEIYVGGAGVARRYVNLPELTAQRFVPDPLAGTTNLFQPEPPSSTCPDVGPQGEVEKGSMYRSGDRGRLLPDGRLEHLGRLDNQVKLRGFRIELDEIRAQLLDTPSVVAATVVLRQPNRDAAAARLDAYVVFRDGQGDTDEVRHHAARFLPEYMVPATVTALPALPLTPNGKVDTAKLPEPLAATARVVPADADPDDDLQATLHAVWETVFGFRVSVDDDFFALGGNSLLAVRLSAAMSAAGLPVVPLPQLYLNRTVRALSAVLAGWREAA